MSTNPLMSTDPFILSEGLLSLPGDWQDHSINVLKFPEQKASLVLTRAWDVAAGEEDAYINQQLATIKQRMTNVVVSEKKGTRIAEQPATEVDLHFDNNTVTVYEKLAVMRVDAHLLVFTFTRTAPFDNAAKDFWEEIKAGLQLKTMLG